MLINFVFICALSLLGALVMIFGQAALNARRASPSGNLSEKLGEADCDTEFMSHYRYFDDVLVHEQGVSALELTGVPAGHNPSLSELTSQLARRFIGLTETIENLPESGPQTLISQDQKLQLSIQMFDLETEITISRRPSAPDTVFESPIDNTKSEGEELQSLRAVTEKLPFLVWRETRDREVTWANNTYLEMVEIQEPDADVQAWPPVRLFDLPDEFLDSNADIEGQIRVRLTSADGETGGWFDVHQMPLGRDALFVAASADAIVNAELALESFVQTLTKTFAHLDSGLAIFDKNRNLTMFNPALSDLTGLRSEFLAKRPGMLAFLDKLRDRRMLPEPKDYKTWRQQMYELECQAAEGTYSEQWPLPDGRTFHVTGRPYPDGAVAFIFKNVSEEVRIKRAHRSEIAAFESVLNSLDEAVAVFDRSGQMVLSNQCYQQMWERSDTTVATAPSLIEASVIWASDCAPSPVWGDIRAFSSQDSERSEWVGQVRKRNGSLLTCRVVPASHGSTLVSFKVAREGERFSDFEYVASISPNDELISVRQNHS